MSKSNRLVIGGESPTNGAASAIAIQEPFTVSVTLQGVCPILFHRWNCEVVESKSKAKKGSAEKKFDDLESYVWRNDKGELCIPGEHIRGAIVHAAKFMQDPRSPRKSAMDLFKAGVICVTELATLGTKSWDFVDKRRAVIQRASITRQRPAMNTGWKATFEITVLLSEYIDEMMIRTVIQNAGKFSGLSDQRPTYGRFDVINWKLLS